MNDKGGAAYLAWRSRDLYKTRSLRIGTCHSCGTRAGLFSRRKPARCTYRRKITSPSSRHQGPRSSFRATIYLPAVPFRRSSPPSSSPEFRCFAEGARWHSVTTLATFPTLSTGLLRQCQPASGYRGRTFREINPADWKASLAVVQHFQPEVMFAMMSKRCGIFKTDGRRISVFW